MDYINFIFSVLVTIIIYIVLIKFFMQIANYIGKKLGIGVFVMKLIKKIKKSIKNPK